MSYIKQIIDSLFDEESEGNIESFKKLIYLSVNQPKKFSPYALEIANMICPILQSIDDNSTKILALQLLAQMSTNFTQQIPANCYEFPQIIDLLADEHPEVRKASHYLLLIFIKKYQKIDQIVSAYLEKARENPDHWKKIQKIIHSFQSLLVIEPKCVTYGQNYTYLDHLLKLLLTYRTHPHTLIQKASDQTVISFVKNQFTPAVISKLDWTTTAQLNQLADKHNIVLSKTNKQKHEQMVDEPLAEKKQNKKVEKKKSLLQILLESIQNQVDWKIKSDTIDQISKKLAQDPSLEIPKDLIDKMLDYSYDYNFKICITALNIIHQLILSHPQQTQNKLKKIEDIMIDKICDLKMAVRQIATKILKKCYQNNRDSAKKILSKLSNCSVVGKEQILLFLQEYYSSSPPFDLSLILTEISTQLSNENTKIKIKTLECLVKISLSNNLEECKLILSKKLNKVYYDMFLDRLKDRNAPQSKTEKWDQKSFNKGLTWQAERSPQIVESNDKFLTKFQFSKKQDRPFQEDTIYDFKYEAPVLDKRQQNKYMMGTSNSSNGTFNTFETPEESVFTKFNKKSNQESYKPTVVASLDLTQSEINSEQKKMPLKPKPIKKININNENVKQETNLVIQSKQYKNKNFNLEQIKQEKPIRSVRINKNKQKQQEQKEKEKDKDKDKDKAQKPKSPFSIKKPGAKKQHTIDYKATQYVSKEELAPVDNPKQLLKDILVNLPKDNDWSKQFDALDGLRRLVKNHEQMYALLQQNLATIMPQVLKLVESLRSSLAKNGMITLSELCETFKKLMDPFLEQIFVKLFRKALDTNTFIVEQVRKCITSLCTYCTSHKIQAVIISNSQTKATPIKLKVIFCIDKLLEKDEYSVSALKENPKIAGVMGNFIIDSSQEVRNLVKEVFLNICNNNQIGEIESIFKKSPKDIWQKWRTIIQKQVR